MPRYQKKIYSGDVYECEVFFSPREIGKKYIRGCNQNMSPEEQQKVNLRYAQKKLSRLINCNFSEGDLFITLTHRERVDYKDAKAELIKYLRKVRRWRIKNNLPELKYISVTESKEKREHHHLIMNEMDPKAAMELWEQGRSMISKLEKGGEYNGLANYITKEPVEEHKKRWSQSRNLQKPKVSVQKIKGQVKEKKLTAPKGYRVTEQYMFYSELTGYVQYLRAVREGGEDWGEGNKTDEKQME